jgi:hypothetical protein
MSISAQATKLPRLLSLLPKDGVGALVYQNRWKGKGFPIPSPDSTLDSNDGACFYQVKRVESNLNEQGVAKLKAFGVLYWSVCPSLSCRGSRAHVMGLEAMAGKGNE